MARVSPKQHSFARGEISPRLYGRQDTELYYTALERAKNYVVDGRGILERRPGTRYLGNTKDNGPATLVPFVYNRTQSYILEMGDLYMRSWFDFGQVQDGGGPSETVTPYTAAQVETLSFTQLRDTMWAAHGTHPLQTIIRDSASTFAISEYEMRDGPYRDENTTSTTAKPSGYGSLSPVMTSNTAPSGTVLETTSHASAFNVFDKKISTYVQITSSAGHIGYQLASGSEVVDGYFVRSASRYSDRMFSVWTMEGYDGASWITLDSQDSQTGWGVSEARYFQIPNQTAYQRYRIVWSGTGDPTIAETWIGEVDFHIRAENQTSFDLTFSAATGINQNNGFTAADVGRQIRVLASDGRWRWLRIASVTSATIVKVVVYDQSLPSLSSLVSWRLGVFFGNQNPEVVTFHDNRLVLSRENRVFFSQAGAYNKFGPSDPDGTINPDNAITVSIPAVNAKKGAISSITFMQSLGFQLVVGTPSGLHTIQSTSFGEGLEPGTVTRRPQDSRGAALAEPIVIGDSVIYIHSSGRKLMGTYYKGSYDKIGAQDLTLPSDHIVKTGLRGVTWQEEPHGIAWCHLNDGTIAALTIQPEEKVQAWQSHTIGGHYIEGGATYPAQVESMATIPDADGGDDRTHLVVKRTIDGSTVRFIEAFTPFWQIGTDPRDSWFLDAALKYEGNADAAKSITFTGTGTDARAAVTNFASPGMVDGDTLCFHDGLRWHHGTISDVDGSNDFTWTPTSPNAPPGPPDGRWHYVDDAWIQLAADDVIDVFSNTYVEPANQTAVTRWSSGVTSLSGLGDFEGEALDVLVDGFPIMSQTVASGALTGLPNGHVMLAGFGFESLGRLMSIEAGSQNGSAQGKQRPVYEVVIDVLESMNLESGTDQPSSYLGAWQQFDPVKFPDAHAVIEGEPVPLFSGLLRVTRDEQGAADDPKIAWRQTLPLPSTVRGVITRLSESDGR